MNIKKDWNEEISYQTEKMTVGNFKACKLECSNLIWKEDNSLYCKKINKEVKKGFVCPFAEVSESG